MDELTRLLLAAAGGDRLALSEFVRRSHHDVWRFCAHLVEPAAADDLTQEVYLRAMRSLPRFRGDASARTWLFAVARHTAADEIRRRQRRRRLPAPGPLARTARRHATQGAATTEGAHATHATDGTDMAELIALRHLVGQLEPGRREAFVLTQVLGLPYGDAAEVCGVPIGTIRSRVARARAELTARLTDAATAGDDPVTTPATGTSDRTR